VQHGQEQKVIQGTVAVYTLEGSAICFDGSYVLITEEYVSKSSVEVG
jgi:hypothetical protein